MALSEFVAMETAYRALEHLDVTARRRAVRWLTDALGVPDALPDASTDDQSPAAVPRSGGSLDGKVLADQPTRRRRTRQGGQTAAAAAPTPPATAGRATRRVAAPKQTRRRASAAGDGQDRPYRRMPPAEDVMAAYREVGSVSGLAEHFGVPRHTIQGWARRLRREGHHIGRPT
jgi:hypothetical protein